ncbi:hypothetical protein FB451DRAFT_1173344 [Mycena latifolia]|nr:hypothetical protein FB451DRAFT_1173344 [Mycena latifolia]
MKWDGWAKERSSDRSPGEDMAWGSRTTRTWRRLSMLCGAEPAGGLPRETPDSGEIEHLEQPATRWMKDIWRRSPVDGIFRRAYHGCSEWVNLQSNSEHNNSDQWDSQWVKTHWDGGCGFSWDSVGIEGPLDDHNINKLDISKLLWFNVHLVLYIFFVEKSFCTSSANNTLISSHLVVPPTIAAYPSGLSHPEVLLLARKTVDLILGQYLARGPYAAQTNWLTGHGSRETRFPCAAPVDRDPRYIHDAPLSADLIAAPHTNGFFIKENPHWTSSLSFLAASLVLQLGAPYLMGREDEGEGTDAASDVHFHSGPIFALTESDTQELLPKVGIQDTGQYPGFLGRIPFPDRIPGDLLRGSAPDLSIDQYAGMAGFKN